MQNVHDVTLCIIRDTLHNRGQKHEKTNDKGIFCPLLFDSLIAVSDDRIQHAAAARGPIVATVIRDCDSIFNNCKMSFILAKLMCDENQTYWFLLRLYLATIRARSSIVPDSATDGALSRACVMTLALRTCTWLPTIAPRDLLPRDLLPIAILRIAVAGRRSHIAGRRNCRRSGVSGCDSRAHIYVSFMKIHELNTLNNLGQNMKTE